MGGRRWVVGALWVVAGACTPFEIPDPVEEERLAIEQLVAEPISVSGTLVDLAGAPIEGARIDAGDASTVTDAAGRFWLDLPTRHNRRIAASAADYTSGTRGVQLLVRGASVELGRFTLGPQRGTQFLFGGDAMLGRRFLDVTGDTPPDQPYPSTEGALVDADAPLPGARAAVKWLAPDFGPADLAVVNLETPIVEVPRDPHPDKSFLFYSPPATVTALLEAGVDYVSLGNNHTYDYGDIGIVDTIEHLDRLGMAHSGAGLDPQSAYEPYPHGEYDLFSMTSIDGRNTGESYVAEPGKGGAADLKDRARLTSAVEASLARGQIPIAQIHSGVEYSAQASSVVREHIELLTDLGVPLVIGHHPHTTQGLRATDSTLAVHSLGNLLFDSNRMQTFEGMMIQVGMEQTWQSAEVVPVYIEDYIPKAPVGPRADRTTRRIASKTEGAQIVHEQGHGWVRLDAVSVDRVVEATVVVGDDGIGVLDLSPLLRPGESVAFVHLAGAEAEATAGTDLLWFGDMEDVDVDDDVLENAHWTTDAESVFACTTRARTGVAALCSTRLAGSRDPSFVSFRHRIRVLGDAEDAPRRELTLLGWTRGQNAGPVSVAMSIAESTGAGEIDRPEVYTHEAGDWPWERFLAHLTLPPQTDEHNARATRVFFEHDVPKREGVGVLAIDDVMVINWEMWSVPIGDSAALPAPNDYDALRIAAPVGEHAVTLTLRAWVAPD